ncbi:MAG: AAA family ATPase [Candidatus Lokiarchaeota archaeon]|nr:AAA family ATPase [Candidatus Lokiarchaeota archaeon]
MIKLNSLNVDGFKNLKNCRLNFPPEGNILITGKNESGKSSLFEAIFFALTSKLLVQKNRGYIDAIAHDKNGAVIDLIFQKNNIPARIRKKIYKTSGGGTTVDIEFWKNFQGEREAPLEGKTTEIDLEIEKFLGFDDQILLNSAFVKQKGLEGFMDESRQDRIDILNKLLNLEKIPEMRENFKSEFKEKEVIKEYLKNLYIIHQNKAQIEKIEHEVKEFDNLGEEYTRIEEKIQKFNNSISEFENLMKKSEQNDKEIDQLKKKIQILRSELEKVNQYKKRIKKYEEAQNILEKLEKDHEKVSIELKNLRERLSEAQKKLENFEKNVKSKSEKTTQVEELNQELEKFNDWNQFLKNQQILQNKIDKKNIEKKKYEERIEEKTAEINKVKDSIRGKIKTKLTTYDNELKLWKKCIQIRKEKNTEFEKLSDLDEKLEEIRNLEKSKQELNHKIELKEQEIKDLKKEVGEKSNLKKNLKVYEEELEESRKRIEDINILIKKINKEKEKYQNTEKLRSRIDGINSKIEKLDERLKWIEGDIQKTREELEPLVERKNKIEELKEKKKVIFDKKGPFFKFLILYIIGLISTILLSVLIEPLIIIGTIIIIGIFITHYLKEKGIFSSYNEENFPQEWYTALKKKQKENERNEKRINQERSNLVNQIREINKELNDFNLNRSEKELNEEKRQLQDEIIKLNEQIRTLENNKKKDNKILKKLHENKTEEKYGHEKKEIQDLRNKKESLTNQIKEIIEKSNLANYNQTELKNKLEVIKDDIKEKNREIQECSKECKNIANSYGIPINSLDLQDYEDILEIQLSDIEYICLNEIDWDNNSEINNKLAQYSLLNIELKEFRELMDFIKRQHEMKEIIEKEIKELISKKDLIAKKIPEKYESQENVFERDFDQKKEEFSKIEQQLEDLNDYFKKTEKDILMKEKNELEKTIKVKSQNYEQINKNIEKQINSLKEIKDTIPDKFLNIEQENKEKSLRDEINSMETQISSKNSEKKTNWNNFKRNISRLTTNKNINALENEKLKEILISERKTQIENLEKLRQTIRNKFPGLKKNFSLAEFKSKMANIRDKSGGLKKEINIAKEENKKMENHRRKSRIINKVDINLNDLEKEYQNIVKKYVILEKAVEILDEAQQNILDKVLPKTEENLTKILPILTVDRYKDAHITEDYQIQLFDSKMGDYVEKTLFSGGTNDQIALAIRLSFAMVTMPQDEYEESFIFLDEPLGFFDDERKSALIDFLTHGIIANIFAQRIVISNFLDIKKYFDYVIELENGRIIEEYSTRTLDSKQIPFEYDIEEVSKIISVEQISYDAEEEFYQIDLDLINNSNKTLDLVQLDIDQVRADLRPKFIYYLKPGKRENIQLGINQYIIDNEDIYFDIKIKMKDGKNGEETVIKKQKIHYVPNLTS